MQRFKEGAAVGAIIDIRGQRGRVIKALVAPGILAGEHPIAGQQAALLRYNPAP
ncbi:MAG TPA: hypothetical protein VI358_14805 [Pseudolabrys sp.]